MNGSTEPEVDEEDGVVMVEVNITSEDESVLGSDLMVMVNVSSDAASTASECVMSNASCALMDRSTPMQNLY